MSGWDDTRVNLLKKLWADGLSASQIACELAGGVTRNAVVGKLHRLGLRMDVKPRKPEPKPTKSKLPSLAIARTARDDGVRIQAANSGAQKERVASRSAREDTAAGLAEVVTVPDEAQHEHATLAPSGPNVDILGLASTNCHWPLGAVHDRPPYRFCGAPTEPDKPYCEHHAKMARSGEQGRRMAPKSDPAKRELLRITLAEVAG